MTLYDIIRKKTGNSFVDYTFLYNPGVDYSPISDKELVKKTWDRVGDNMKKSLIAFASNMEDYVDR